MAAEQQQGILAAPALAALLGGAEAGQKPAASVCFSSSGTITEPLSSLYGFHLFSFLNLLGI